MDDYTAITPANSVNQDRMIAALYETRSEAESAHDALKTSGFVAVNISYQGDDSSDENTLWEGIKAFFSGHHHDVGVYKEGVRRGKTLVTVHVSDDRLEDAIGILDRFGPLDLDTHEASWRNEGWSGESVTAVGDTGDGHNRPADLGEPGAIPGRRDLDRGNARIRSYGRGIG